MRTRTAVLLALGAAILGAAFALTGALLAGGHPANLAPLQAQVRTLQAQVSTLQAQVTTDTGEIAGDGGSISQLTGEYGLLKIDGITTYDESCPIGGVWLPCSSKEPPGFSSAG
jgi:outer membrane murein-binding lipoprotein Lpp